MTRLLLSCWINVRKVYKRLNAARIESRIESRLLLPCLLVAMLLIVLPIHLDKCSENNMVNGGVESRHASLAKLKAHRLEKETREGARLAWIDESFKPSSSKPQESRGSVRPVDHSIDNTQQSAPKAATTDASRNEVRLAIADRMSATYQKCLHIASKLRPEIVMAAYRYGAIYGIEPELLLAIAYVESSFNPLARSKSSIGLMGINYRVWRKELSLEFNRLYEVDYNMGKGALILRRYINKSGDLWQGVHLYNNGYRGQNMAYVPKVKAMYKKIMEASCQL